MKQSLALVWFRRNLRLNDNPALERALATHDTVVPIFIWAPDEEKPWAPGGASRWWLHQSLTELSEALSRRGSRLILRCGPTEISLFELIRKTHADSVFWTRRYEPAVVARDRRLAEHLNLAGVNVEISPGELLFEPGAVLNKAGKPYQVYGAFWRACLAMPEPQLSPRVPSRIPGPNKWPQSLTVAGLDLEPTIDWAGGLRESWTPGEAGASQQLNAFLEEAISDYAIGRNRPDRTGTSRLSPHLHFGEISPRQVWRKVLDKMPESSEPYLKQIVWREFSYHLLVHFPHTPLEPMRPEFRLFPWRVDAEALNAWTKGLTGYPLVDAGMRELWHTGWMHNRVRMSAASFLVKHLLIAWQEGAMWFWDTLVDADLANNTMGWQWTSGCGADASPYFRIFNPVLQGEKFDPEGAYVRRWIPELGGLPSRWIHKPWKAPAAVLSQANIELGKDYPLPIVDHDKARRRALAGLKKVNQAKREVE